MSMCRWAKIAKEKWGLKTEEGHISLVAQFRPAPAVSDAAVLPTAPLTQARPFPKPEGRPPPGRGCGAAQESNEKENHSVQLGFEFQACRLQELFVAAICWRLENVECRYYCQAPASLCLQSFSKKGTALSIVISHWLKSIGCLILIESRNASGWWWFCFECVERIAYEEKQPDEHWQRRNDAAAAWPGGAEDVDTKQWAKSYHRSGETGRNGGALWGFVWHNVCCCGQGCPLCSTGRYNGAQKY